VEFFVKIHIENTSPHAVKWGETEIDLSCDGRRGVHGFSDAQWGDLEIDAPRDAEPARGTVGRHGKALMATVRFTTDDGVEADGGAAAAAEDRVTRSWTLEPNSNDEHHVKVSITIPHAAKRRWIELSHAMFAAEAVSYAPSAMGGAKGGSAPVAAHASGRTLKDFFSEIASTASQALRAIKAVKNPYTVMKKVRSHFISISKRVGVNWERMDPRFDVAVALKLDNGDFFDYLPNTWFPDVSLPIIVNNHGGFAEGRDDASSGASGGEVRREISLLAKQEAAKRNYETFYSYPRGTITAAQVAASTEGILGWAAGHGAAAVASSDKDEVGAEAKEMFPAFYAQLEEGGVGEGKHEAIGMLKELMKKLDTEESSMPNVVALIGKILVRVTPADSCDLFTEMTASYFLYQLLGVVKDAFAFQTFRREAAINASSSSVADRWKRMGKDDRNLFFRRNKVGVLPNPIFCSFLWSLSSTRSPISVYTHSSLLFVLALTNKGWNEIGRASCRERVY
jgi:hypothetical protein